MDKGLDFFLYYHPFLMVAVPIYLVLRLGWRGVFYGMFGFWLLGVAGNQVRWSLHGESDPLWLMLGLPVGLVYSGLVFGLSKFSLWGWRRSVSSTATGRIGIFGALIIAVTFGALFWQCRPYGMGTSSMIEAVERCPQNVVRFVWNEPWYFHNYGSIDLEKGTYQIGGSDESDNEFGSVTLTCGGATTMETALSAEKIAQIRQLLQTIPREHKLFFQRYEFTRNIYVSYWRNGSREILVYRRGDFPEDVASLFRALSPHVLDEVEGKED